MILYDVIHYPKSIIEDINKTKELNVNILLFGIKFPEVIGDSFESGGSIRVLIGRNHERIELPTEGSLFVFKAERYSSILNNDKVVVKPIFIDPYKVGTFDKTFETVLGKSKVKEDALIIRDKPYRAFYKEDNTYIEVYYPLALSFGRDRFDAIEKYEKAK